MIDREEALRDLELIKQGKTNKYIGEIKTDTDKIIEAIKVLVKIIVNIRTNQLLTEKEKEYIQERKREELRQKSEQNKK